MRLDPSQVRHQIDNLRISHPELVEDEDAWIISLESETEIDDLLRAVERKRQEAACLAGALAGNIAELGLRQERFERREKAMRELLFKIMETAQLRKKELAEATLSIRAVAPRVIIVDENDLPGEALKTVLKPDLARIKELLSVGPCPGATMSNGGTTISIRTK